MAAGRAAVGESVRVELTISAETKATIERIQELMRHRNPSGDLEKILEASLDLLATKLEKERLGKTIRSKEKTPSTTTDEDSGTSSAARRPPKLARRGHVARAVQREVWARDTGQCTYLDAEGNRCPARGFLELDHIHAKARGGSDEATNLRLRCRVHNRLHAEHVFGRAYVEERIYLRQRESAVPAQADRKQSAPAQADRMQSAPAQAERKQSAPAQADRMPSAPTQAQRKPFAPAQAPSFERAARGLRTLGFRDSEVREVITRLASSLGPDTSAETVVRDALRLLT